jgi:hypothetical protein
MQLLTLQPKKADILFKADGGAASQLQCRVP